MKKNSKEYKLAIELHKIYAGKVTDFKRGSVKKIKKLLVELVCDRVAAHCTDEDIALDEKRDMDAVIFTLQTKLLLGVKKSLQETETIDADVLRVVCKWLVELEFWNLRKNNLMKNQNKEAIKNLLDVIKTENPILDWDMQYVEVSIMYETVFRKEVKASFEQSNDKSPFSIDSLILSIKTRISHGERYAQVKRIIICNVLIYLQSLRNLRYQEIKKEMEGLFRTVETVNVR